MNLKEAFHYQNTLNSLAASAALYIGNQSNMVCVEQTHLKNAADPAADNEVIDATKERPHQISNNDMIRLYVGILDERQRLALAVQEAKANCGFALDANLSTNRMRQDIVRTLHTLSRVKPSERMTYANGYKFNVEGNQVPYRYDVREVTTIDFDRNLVKSITQKLQIEANEISKEADRCMISVELKDFEPRFDIDGSFDDVVEAYAVSTTVPANDAYEARYERHAV